MNRRGLSEGIFSFVGMLALFLLFSVGVFIAIGSFFGDGYDFRSMEAEILSFKVEKCLLENEIDWISGNLYESCRFNGNVLENFEENRLGILICEGSCEDEEVLFKEGSDFTSCNFGEEKSRFMRCKSSFVDSEFGYFEIVTGSLHESKEGR